MPRGQAAQNELAQDIHRMTPIRPGVELRYPIPCIRGRRPRLDMQAEPR
jgi:hypothetical protein